MCFWILDEDHCSSCAGINLVCPPLLLVVSTWHQLKVAYFCREELVFDDCRCFTRTGGNEKSVMSLFRVRCYCGWCGHRGISQKWAYCAFQKRLSLIALIRQNQIEMHAFDLTKLELSLDSYWHWPNVFTHLSQELTPLTVKKSTDNPSMKVEYTATKWDGTLHRRIEWNHDELKIFRFCLSSPVSKILCWRSSHCKKSLESGLPLVETLDVCYKEMWNKDSTPNAFVDLCNAIRLMAVTCSG